MSRISAAFFTIGVSCVLCGMLFGMWMGAHNDFAAAPAHAHLDLIGGATMALYGVFYPLTQQTMSVRLA
jgi:hypothetical protein